MKSAVARGSQKHTSSGSQDRTDGQQGRASCTSSSGHNKQLGDPEKKELRDRPHRWIESWVKRLDPAGYMEEIHSMHYFGRNASFFTLQIMAIADWGRKFMDVGLNHPIPAFPDFLFTLLPESHQGRAQVHVRPSQVRAPGGDVRDKCREAWKWMVTLLQFWGDEASSTDGIVYGGCERPVSALAKSFFNTINPGLEPGSKVSWDDVVIRTPWMAKRLHGMMAAQEKTVRHQALPQPGESSDLELTLERRYSEHVLSLSMGRGKLVTKKPTTPGPKPITSPPGLTKAGRGDLLLHLKKATQGEGWTHMEQKDSGPNVGCPYQTPKEADKPQEGEQAVQPDRSPLTSELLALGEELIRDLDYEDVQEADLGLTPDPEIVQAVAHIPQTDAWADVEMQESHSPPGFEPEVSRSGYDVNLVHTNPSEPGSASLVTAGEDKMLDEVAISRTPGAGRLGTDENPDRTEDN